MLNVFLCDMDHSVVISLIVRFWGLLHLANYVGLKKTYNELYKIYYPQEMTKPADVVVTEDSNSGSDPERDV